MYEVSAAKKKDSAPSKMPAVLPVIPSRRVGSALNFYWPNPQYRYPEDQTPSKKLLSWILEGKLNEVTPAHIIAASPSIRKELAERLMPRRVGRALDTHMLHVLTLSHLHCTPACTITCTSYSCHQSVHHTVTSWRTLSNRLMSQTYLTCFRLQLPLESTLSYSKYTWTGDEIGRAHV